MLYIATLDEIKTLLGISDNTDDVSLRLLLEGIQGRFDAHCRRGFLYSATEQQIFDGGLIALYTYRSPIQSVAEIVVDADQDWTNANSILDTTDYLVAKQQGKIIYGRGNRTWPMGAQSIRVTYAGGLIKSDGTAATYATPGDVQSLKRAFYMQAMFEWRNREQVGLSQISQQGTTIQQGSQPSLALAGQTLIPEVQTTLAHLVRMA